MEDELGQMVHKTPNWQKGVRLVSSCPWRCRPNGHADSEHTHAGLSNFRVATGDSLGGAGGQEAECTQVSPRGQEAECTQHAPLRPLEGV